MPKDLLPSVPNQAGDNSPKDLLPDVPNMEQMQQNAPQTMQDIKNQYGSMDPISDFFESASLGFPNMMMQAGLGVADLLGRPLGVRAPKVDLKKYAPQKNTFEAFNLLGAGALPFKPAREGAGMLEKGLNLSAQGGLYGALFGSQEDDIKGGAMRGAATAPLVAGGLSLLGKGAQKIMGYLPESMQSKVFEMLQKDGHLTPEKIGRAQEIHNQFQEKGIPIDLMSLLDSPEGIKMLDTIIRTVPDNAAAPMIRTTLEAENRVLNNFAEHLSGGSKHENLDREIQKEVKGYFGPKEAKNAQEWQQLKGRVSKLNVKEHKPLDDFIAEELENYKRAEKSGDEPAMSKAMKSVLETVSPKYEQVSAFSPEGVRIGEKDKRILGSVADRMDTYRAEGQKFQDIIDAKNPYDNVVLAKLRGHIEDQLDKSLQPHFAQKKPHFQEWQRLKKQHIEDVIPTRTPTMQDILKDHREVNEQKYIDNLLNESNRKALTQLPQKTVNKILLKHILQKHPNSFDEFKAGRFSKSLFPENLSSAKLLNTLTNKNFDLKASPLLDETSKRHIGHIINFKDMTKDYRIMAKNIFGTGRDVSGQIEELKGKAPLDAGMIGIATGSPKKALEAIAYKQLRNMADEKGPQALREFSETIFDTDFINSLLSGEQPKGGRLARKAKKIKGAKGAQRKASQAATLRAILGAQQGDNN